MKTKLFILLFLFISSITIGQNNVIQVRKVTYDTSFYTKKTYDTAFTVKSIRFNIAPNFTNERTGYWRNNVFFDSDSLYVFTRPITNRQAKLATKNPEKFWDKIDRKKRKNKCGVYAIAYNFYEALTTYQIDTITTTHYQIRNNSTNEITRNENLEIFRDTASFDLVYRKYWFISDYDSILLNTTKEGFEFCGGLQEGRIQCLFISLITSLENNYERNRAFGFYRYSGKINDKRCKMFLNFESHLIRKAVIIENNESRFYCDFDVSNDSLFIFNSPIGEIHTGRVARKKNKIRFRNDRRSYNFYQKKRQSYTSRRLNGYEVNYYYTYPVVD